MYIGLGRLFTLDIMGILRNEILIVSLLSWLIAQVIKTIIHAIMYKGIDWKRLVGDGGMPSAHSATVTSLAICTGLKCGFDSVYFAIAFVFAIVVMHDATGVRREAGKHAKALNEIIEFLNREPASEEALKEFLGHTPLQVFFGALLGIIISLIACLVVVP